MREIFSYDTAFMFACVNADYAKWLVKKHTDGEIEILDLLWTNKAWLKIGIFSTPNFNYLKILTQKRLRSVNVSLRSSWELIIINRWKLSMSTNIVRDQKKTKKLGPMLKNLSDMVKNFFLEYASLRHNSLTSTPHKGHFCSVLENARKKASLCQKTSLLQKAWLFLDRVTLLGKLTL